MNKINSICVFCGSNYGSNPIFQKKAEDLGKYLANNKITLVFGGNSDGIMGTISKTVMKNNGKVIGITAQNIEQITTTSTNITQIIKTPDISERKKKMLEYSDAFIAFPGGWGTLEELSTIISWKRAELHNKPLALLNVNHFYDKLWAFFQITLQKSFISKKDLDSVICSSDIQEIINFFKNF